MPNLPWQIRDTLNSLLKNLLPQLVHRVKSLSTTLLSPKITKYSIFIRAELSISYLHELKLKSLECPRSETSG